MVKLYYQVTGINGWNYVFDLRDAAVTKADSLDIRQIEILRYDPLRHDLVHVRWFFKGANDQWEV